MKLNRTAAQWGAILLSAAAFAACGDDDDDNGTGPGGNPPATPTGLTTSLDVYDLTVSWDAVAGATTYAVSVDDGDPDTPELTETGAGTSVTFARVPAGADLDVSVTAGNADGTSAAATTTVATPGLNMTFFMEDGYNNLVADPGLDASAFNAGTAATPPDFTVDAMPAGYTAATIPTAFDGNLIQPGDGRTLDDTDYAGAIEPGTALADAWYNGWTVWATDGSDSRTDYDALPEVEVTGTIDADVTWTSGNVYRLNGPVFVGTDCGTDGTAADCNEVVLTIEPGTTIIGETDIAAGERGSYLVITRGSQIIADAFADGGDPTGPPAEEDVIVFTSERIIDGTAARADWGGLIINGQAPTNAGEEAEGEGDSGFYGGTDEGDDSGILRGVRIEFAGDDVTATDQLNGLAMQAVGSNTTFSWIQIHYNEDDGIEPFGGTASVDHLVLTGIGDDSMDGTDGYRGFMQYVLIQQRGDNADNGMELSNNGDTPEAAPQSTSIVANVTAIGAGENVVTGDIAGAESDNGVQLREGSNYRLYNSIITGFGEGGFCIRDGQTIVNALNALEGETDPTTTVTAQGLILWNNQAADDSDENFAPCGGGSS